MSSELGWLLTRNTSSFVVKRNGLTLSREPGNLYNEHSLKFSTVSDKPLAISLDNTVSWKKKSVAGSKVAKSVASTKLSDKSSRRAAKAIKKIVGGYRPDLVKAALARVSRVVASKKTPKALKPKKVRGKQ